METELTLRPGSLANTGDLEKNSFDRGRIQKCTEKRISGSLGNSLNKFVVKGKKKMGY